MDKRVRILAALAGLIALSVWLLPSEPVIQTVVREVTPQALLDTIEDLRIERDGLMARLRGVEEREPATIYVVDTLVPPPDTILRFMHVDSRGYLTYERLTALDGLYAPSLVSRISVFDCDDGYQVDVRGVTCDRAVLGHLYLRGGARTASPYVELAWRRTIRSRWELAIGFDRDGLYAGISASLRIF